MTYTFDPGYVFEPFTSLVEGCPGADVFPIEDFRLEWGPVFHRGRLDGTARVVVLGQDPAAHEAIAGRTLVGEAGQRTQGFLAKLGIETSYVMINTYVYSVFGQRAGNRHKDNADIAAYRHAWLDALIVGRRVEAVVSLGRLAAHAFETWRATPAGAAAEVAYQAMIHPTYPEAVSRSGRKKKAEAMRDMLANWNEALEAIRPHIHQPEVNRDLVLYGDELTDADVAPIPAIDMPAGAPPWMRSIDAWAVRKGDDKDSKRATIVVRVPRKQRPWM